MDHKAPEASAEQQEDIGTNVSGNPHISDILEARLSRRQALMGGFSATAAAIFGGGLGGALLAGCDNEDEPASFVSKLGFNPVAKNLNDAVTVPSGYTATVLYAMGDTFVSSESAWNDTGTESGDSYNYRAGDHHDGLYFFGLSAGGTSDPTASDRGILCMNHEAMNPFDVRTGGNGLYYHAGGATVNVTGTAGNSTATPPVPETRVANRSVADEVVKEINTHGVSVIEIKKTAGVWSVVKDSAFNRRVTGTTTMNINGPLRGNAALITKFSPDATQTQGTINNCANGYTPWGTYLTCEENWVGYFSRAAGDNAKRTRTGEAASLARYGSAEGALQRGNWDTGGTTDYFKRWNTSVVGASTDGSDDFRNVVNQFGFVVEIDPFNASSTPVKHTGLGRFAHEGCWPGKVVVGKPIVYYMGDDNRGDYIYKYVSTALWDAADANPADRLATGAKYLDNGKLYVARFNADGSGDWIELTGTQAYLDTRIAADAKGATRMDRPEWGAVNPVNGEVYFSLTNSNSANRLVSGTPSGNAALTDPANPRFYNDPRSNTGTSQTGNPNGHIIRWRENTDDSSALRFQWDIFLFGARASMGPDINMSRLTAENDLSSPDGLWFARPGTTSTGLLWIQTDDGAYTDVTNCMLLAAQPGTVGDGEIKSFTSVSGSAVRSVATYVGREQTPAILRRFLVGPKECEITGIDSTPDGKTLFVNIQHPGEEKRPTLTPAADPATFGSHWPAGGNARPRSATIVITKNDGGVVGV